MRKALVVGINDYPTAPLRGCVNDAIVLANTIQKNGDGSPNFDVKLLENVKTKADLKSQIVALFAGESDVTLFYFSGHGFLSSTGGYLVTPDAQSHDEGVSMDDLLTIANQSKSKDKIIILDCCNSGAAGSPAITEGKISTIGEGMVILTASRSDEVSIEVNGHGLFTSLLLDALQGGAADLRGHITPGSVYAYIDQALGSWDQRPIFKTNVSRFTSLRTVTPPLPLEIIRKIVEYFPTPAEEHKLDPSYEDTNQGVAIAEKVAIFKNLQKFVSVGLVKPVGEEHMFFAAQNSKSCKLTALGYHYWRLVNENKI